MKKKVPKKTKKTASVKKAKSPTRKSAKKSVPKSRKKKATIAASSGGKPPVTLEEAKALIDKKRLRRAAKKVKSPSEAITLGSVGIARRRLRTVQSKEERDRISEYTALMKIMKDRGVKGLDQPKSSGSGRRRAAGKKAHSAGQPLQVLAEGDSV